MGRVKHVEPVIAICAVISRYEALRVAARQRLQELWGELETEGTPVAFEAEEYYRETMGDDLKKVMLAAMAVQDPGRLADWKLATNAIEAEVAGDARWQTARPLNLDPGYITQSKLVLATVKDRDHRIYLRDGIFAEVTLRRLRSGWVDNRWTYRDYRGEEIKAFAESCRRRLRECLIAQDGFRRC